MRQAVALRQKWLQAIRKGATKEEMEKHVNRHLLCHGAQLNYGTKEHALKVILCIDALATVAAVIADNLEE